MNFLQNLADNMFQQQVKIDPAAFNDPLALQTSWEPLKRGGSNFQTHKLVQAGGNRIEFKTTVFMKVFSVIFMIVPIAIYFVFLHKPFMAEGFKITKESAFVFLFIAVFGFAGVALFINAGKATIFDKNYGCFWKGKQKKDSPINPMNIKGAIQLSEIHALQIIYEWCKTGGKHKRRYKSYELNLVLKSGDRVNVVDHGDKKKLLEDADTLAQFLGVPVWNAVGQV